MLKKYKAKSCISISVALSTGGVAHVSFSPMTGGGSTFYTDDTVLQEGLEKHPKFGRLFVLVERGQSAPPNHTTTNDSVLENTAEVREQPSDTSQTTIRRVEMQCNDDAKDYLAEKFGISRSKLRSRADIEKAAQANGIQIIWPSRKKSEGTGEVTEEEAVDATTVNEVTEDEV